MNFKLSQLAMAFMCLVFLASCGSDDDTDIQTTETFDLEINGLEDLGQSAIYEGWLIVDGNPVSTGLFSVNSDGVMSSNTFTAEKEDIESASTFVLTIEPVPDPDPAPSAVHIVAGDFTNGTADLTVGHPAAINNDFTDTWGKYILATPTTETDTDEASGIWFLDNSSGMPAVGLSLPTLPEGWAYEGWAVIDGTPVSTGTFTSMASADNASPYSVGGPSFPGEDFIMNAPAGLTFPTDLTGATAVISIEPVPDNSPAPFLLKPLVSQIPMTAPVHSVLDMSQNLESLPIGQAIKNNQ